MPRFLQLTITGCLALFLTLSGDQQALAKGKHHKVKERTEWVAISEAPGVHHTVWAGQDVFRYQNHYYRYDGRWHRGSHHGGPWVAIPAPPPVIYRVDRVYFKRVPPGWHHGRKTGWQGAPMPHGQMKKFH